ncbi:uncharacterized protein LOC135807154 [Sycon ciliatum]|uniref:uncharacterized protein LOC135807154 n=1 Tax=Sycon ciliatum TaxID=27933 RepID=UPI0020AADEFF|eukprot:scpid76443/ scgid21250/ 
MLFEKRCRRALWLFALVSAVAAASGNIKAVQADGGRWAYADDSDPNTGIALTVYPGRTWKHSGDAEHGVPTPVSTGDVIMSRISEVRSKQSSTDTPARTAGDHDNEVVPGTPVQPDGPRQRMRSAARHIRSSDSNALDEVGSGADLRVSKEGNETEPDGSSANQSSVSGVVSHIISATTDIITSNTTEPGGSSIIQASVSGVITSASATSQNVSAEKSSGDGSNVGAIVGPTVAAVLLISIIAVLVYVVYIRHTRIMSGSYKCEPLYDMPGSVELRSSEEVVL